MTSSARGLHVAVGRGLALALAVAPLSRAACGDDDSKGSKTTATKAPTPLAITTSDAGSKRFRTKAPTSIEGGLVELTFTNAGKDGHEAQLLRIDGVHSARGALKIVTAEPPAPIPDWLHAAGGAGSTAPGRTVKATLNLDPGKYVMIDNDNQDGPPNSTRGALAEFQVTSGKAGVLPASTATITAATDEQAKPENSFEIAGLKAGKNRLRLVTKGDEPHHAVMFPILPGKTIADVKKFFAAERPSGPPPVDFASGANTAVLDGDSEQVGDLVLRKPGKYAVVCFLTDRDGKGKPHLAEGMLKEVEVK